jgi:hypothetical protein
VLEGLTGELFVARGNTHEKMQIAEPIEPVARTIESSDITGALVARDVSYAHMPHGAQKTDTSYIIVGATPAHQSDSTCLALCRIAVQTDDRGPPENS